MDERSGDFAADVDVVLPVLDEADALPLILPRLPSGYRAIVVDNGSTDRSAAVAAELGALVVSEPLRGFGAACYRGLVEATAEVVAFMDADASLDPTELPAVVDPVRAGRAQLVLGRRACVEGTWPAHARLANRFLAWRLSRRFDLHLTDLGPMRAAPRAELLALGITDRRSGWPLEMVVRAGRAGWTITQADVGYHQRVGRSKVTGTVRGTLTAVHDQLRVLRSVMNAPS